MRTLIFENAIRLQKYLEEYGTWHNKIKFEFKFENQEQNILADISIDENKTTLSCTCMHGSVCPTALCSHKLAIIFFLFKKQMRRLKVKW